MKIRKSLYKSTSVEFNVSEFGRGVMLQFINLNGLNRPIYIAIQLGSRVFPSGSCTSSKNI